MANAQALMASAFGSMPQGGHVSGGTVDSTSADAYYQTQLRQYVSQNEAMQKLMQTKYEADVAAAKEAEERAYKEHWANQTAQGIQQMVGDPGQEGGLINQPNRRDKPVHMIATYKPQRPGIRPEGIGRCGSLIASTWRSNQSLIA